MRVAWLAWYPTSYFWKELGFSEPIFAHPASWIVNLSRRLSKESGIDLHIFTLRKELRRDRTISHDGVTYHFLVARRYALRLGTAFRVDMPRLCREISEIAPDIVHAHGTEDAYALGALASGYPCVISIQGLVGQLLRARGFRMDSTTLFWSLVGRTERKAIRRGKYFITRTGWDADFVRGLNPSATIFSVWELMHEAYWEPENKATGNGSEVCFVGTLNEFKGSADLVSAIALLRDDYPDLQLRLVGRDDTPYVKKRLVPQIRRLGLESSVEFCGFKPAKEVADILSTAAMVVVPSYMEKSPNVVSGAMLAGVPVVATRVGGIPSMIEDGVSGVLVEPKRPRAMADGIRWMLEHPEEREEMARRARETARIRHEPSGIVRRTIKVYEEVIAG